MDAQISPTSRYRHRPRLPMEEGMSIHVVAEDVPATTDSQVIAELATGALESIARIHAAGLAELVDIAENPAPLQAEVPADAPAADVQPEAEVEEQVETEVTAEAEVAVEAEAEVAVEAEAEVAVEAEAEVAVEAEESATAEVAAPAETEVVQPVEALRAVPQSTRGRHLSEAETTEFATQRAA